MPRAGTSGSGRRHATNPHVGIEDLVRFVDGFRQGESSEGQTAAADVGKVDVRPVLVENTKDQ